MRWVLGALLALLLAAPARADVYDDNPATASRGPGDTWVFVRGKDGDVLMRHYDGSYWTDWSSLGGEATSGPAAAAYGDQLFVFVRGTDGALYSAVGEAGARSAARSRPPRRSPPTRTAP